MSTQLAEIADSRDRIEQMGQDAREMLIASNLEQADAWLRAALDVPSPDPRSIVDYRIQVAAIEQMARQLRISRETQEHASECVRRAERGEATAIRQGQEDGTILKQGDIGGGGRGGDTAAESRKLKRNLLDSPKEIEPNNNVLTDAYRMAEASDEEFEEALDEARDEGNLSRANVVRKIKNPGQTVAQLADQIREHAGQGLTSKQIAEKVGRTVERVRLVARENDITIPADIVTRRRQNLDAEHIMTAAVEYTAAVADSLKMIDPNELDPSDVTEWVKSIEKSARSILATTRQMKEQNHA